MIPQCKKKKYKDITAECTFFNCTHDYGTIFVDEEAKIVYFNLMLTTKVTNGWIKILELPEKYAPISITDTSGGGCTITASEFWASVSSNKTIVSGAITAGEQITFQGYYFLKDFMNA